MGICAPEQMRSQCISAKLGGPVRVVAPASRVLGLSAKQGGGAEGERGGGERRGTEVDERLSVSFSVASPDSSGQNKFLFLPPAWGSLSW